MASDLSLVAAGSSPLGQAAALLSRMTHASLCATVDSLESEMDDLRRVKHGGMRAIEAGVDAQAMLAERREEAGAIREIREKSSLASEGDETREEISEERVERREERAQRR